MQVTTEELNPCTILMTVTVEAERVKDAFNRAIKDLSKSVRIPGFRPGSAPRKVAERYLDPVRIQQRAVDIAISKAYQEAIKETGIEPYGQPSVDLEKVDEESPLVFKVKVPLTPKIELGEYKGVPAQKQKVEVTEEEINENIDTMLRQQAKFTKIEDRAAETGDSAMILVEPQEGDDVRPRRFFIEIGKTFGALDQALAGMNPDDEKILSLNFPSDFQEESWAGNLLNVNVKLLTLQSIELPPLDEEFAKQLGTESVEDFRDKITQAIQSSKEAQAQDEVDELVFNEVINRSEVFIPDNMWEDKAEDRIAQLEEDLEKQKVPIEEYATKNNMTVEELKNHIQEDMKNQMIRLVIIQEIAKKEDMRVNPEEMAEQIIFMARRANVTPDQMRQHIEKNQSADEVFIRALFKKVVGFLAENAEVSVVG
ncbi:MAG: trigger factor [bacterium]|jgi:trigger factor